jgi:hypothetical protein
MSARLAKRMVTKLHRFEGGFLLPADVRTRMIKRMHRSGIKYRRELVAAMRSAAKLLRELQGRRR